MQTTKLANFQQADEGEFEKIFSNAAFNDIRSAAPKLLDYMIGFQMIERNQDGTKAFGVTGFRVGTEWMYVPSIFMDNGIYGSNMLFSSRLNTIVPLTNRWVDFLLGSVAEYSGEAVFDTNEERGGRAPNLREFSDHYRSGTDRPKLASADEMGEGYPFFAALLTKQARFLFGQHEELKGRKYDNEKVAADPFEVVRLAGFPTLDEFAKENPGSQEILKQAVDEFSEYSKGLREFYGGDCLNKWAEHFEEVEARKGSILRVHSARAEPKTAASPSIGGEFTPRVHMYSQMSDIDSHDQEQNLKEKEEIRRNGSLIKDDRDADKNTDVYRKNVTVGLANPTSKGKYSVLTVDGGFVDAFVHPRPLAPGSSDGTAMVLIKDGSKYRYILADLVDVWAEPGSVMDDSEECYESFPAGESLKVDSVYVAICEDGQASAPFNVYEKLGDRTYQVSYLGRNRRHDRWSNVEPGQSIFGKGDKEAKGPFSNDTGSVQLSNDDSPRRNITFSNGRLLLPQNCKLVKLESVDYGCCSIPCSADADIESDEHHKIHLGTPTDVEALLGVKTAEVTVTQDHGWYRVNTPFSTDRYRQKEATFKLMVDHGLTREDADLLYKEAAISPQEYRLAYGENALRYKKAAALPAMRGPQKANVDFSTIEDKYSQEVGKNRRVSVLESQYDDQTVEDDDLYKEMNNYDPWHDYEPGSFQKTLRTAETATQQGHKTLFDVSSITALLGSVRTDRSIDDYLKSLFKGMDALGRLSINFYWHKEDFEERYGKSELPELGDALQNAFESVGDTLLFLKEKTVESRGDLFDLSIDSVADN